MLKKCYGRTKQKMGDTVIKKYRDVLGLPLEYFIPEEFKV
jgi:hypothetical protein